MLQKRAVHKIYFVCAPAEGLISQMPDIVAEHECGKFYPKVICKYAAFAQKLPGDFMGMSFKLFYNNPDAFPGGDVGLRGLLLLFLFSI